MIAAFVNQSKPGVEKPKNQTLEDVAEEMLNGMFCHYEPPDPRRVKRSSKKTKTKGILRRPSMSRKSNGNKKKVKSSEVVKTVTWSESVEGPEVSPKNEDVDVPSATCNVAQACIDAGIEAGCISQRKEKVVSSKSNSDKMNRSFNSVNTVIPSSSTPFATNPSNSQPPPPPPPRRKERFYPSLCGVNITCGEDEEQMEMIVNDSNNTAQKRSQSQTRRAHAAEEDDDNSLLQDEDDGSDYEEDDEENDDSDKENGSDSSSTSKRVSRYHSSEAEHANILIRHNPQQEDERRPSMREVIATYSNDGDNDEEASTVSQKFFRRLWPGKR
jgi:hypothetical protein